MATKDELREKLDAFGAEQPPADAKKEELEKALEEAKADNPDPSDPNYKPEGRVGLAGKDERVPDEQKGAVARGEAIAVDEEKAEELKERTVSKEEAAKLADKRLETVEEEAGPETAELVTEELDKAGPLHIEDPRTRVMTGAINEDHAKEQEKLLKDTPDYEGFNPSLVTEAGYPEEPERKTRYFFPDGKYDEEIARKAEEERFKADGVDIRPLSEQYAEVEENKEDAEEDDN